MLFRNEKLTSGVFFFESCEKEVSWHFQHSFPCFWLWRFSRFEISISQRGLFFQNFYLLAKLVLFKKQLPSSTQITLLELVWLVWKCHPVTFPLHDWCCIPLRMAFLSVILSTTVNRAMDFFTIGEFILPGHMEGITEGAEDFTYILACLFPRRVKLS